MPLFPVAPISKGLPTNAIHYLRSAQSSDINIIDYTLLPAKQITLKMPNVNHIHYCLKTTDFTVSWLTS